MRSIKSVLNQTYQDFEIIVVDDCSIDSTERLVTSIKDKRVHYFKLPVNGGACVARNFGINQAKGEYIAFHDSDDVSRPERLESQLQTLIKMGADVVFCAYQTHHKFKAQVLPRYEGGFKSFEDLAVGKDVSTQTILGKSEVFKNIKFDEKVKRMQDYDLILRVALKYRIYFDKKVLIDLYLQPDSIGIKNSKFRGAHYIMKKYSTLVEKYPKWKLSLLKMEAMDEIHSGEDASPILWKIYKQDKGTKNLIYYITGKFGILPIIFKLKDFVRENIVSYKSRINN